MLFSASYGSDFDVIPMEPDHVGIYVGRGRFVHAPSSGKRVTVTELSDPYWRKRLLAAGRFY